MPNAIRAESLGAIEMKNESIELLRARGQLSMARHYLWDLENNTDFSRMVDSRGAPFNCSRAIWIERINRIAGELMTLLPDEATELTDRLELACHASYVVPVAHVEEKKNVEISDRVLHPTEIVRFANILGEINHGIVVDRDLDGCLLIMWDEFTDLLARLERQGRVGDFVRNGLSKRLSWVRVESPRPNGATMELLPIDTPVQWNDGELAVVQAKRIKEKQST